MSRNYSTSHALDLEQKGSVVGNCMGENNGAMQGGTGYGDLQSLSLSMSPGSQSSCVTASHQISPAAAAAVAHHDCVAILDTKKRGPEKVDQKQIVHRKSLDTFGQRTSQYRGVTRLVFSWAIFYFHFCFFVFVFVFVLFYSLLASSFLAVLL